VLGSSLIVDTLAAAGTAAAGTAADVVVVVAAAAVAAVGFFVSKASGSDLLSPDPDLGHAPGTGIGPGLEPGGPSACPFREWQSAVLATALAQET